MFLQVRTAKGPVVLPTPVEEAQEALASLRRHRLQTDVDMAEALRAAQTEQRRQLRISTIKSVVLGVLAVTAILLCSVSLVATHPSVKVIQIVFFMATFFGFLALSLSTITAWVRRATPIRKCKELELALVALAQKDYENNEIEQFFNSSYRSMKPLTPDDFNWGRTTSEAKKWPELAEIWTDWLLGDKPVRHRDARDLTDTANKLEKAREWLEQVATQQDLGENFQMDNRAVALQDLPSDLVAARREKLLGAKLSSSAVAAPPRPRF